MPPPQAHCRFCSHDHHTEHSHLWVGPRGFCDDAIWCPSCSGRQASGRKEAEAYAYDCVPSSCGHHPAVWLMAWTWPVFLQASPIPGSCTSTTPLHRVHVHPASLHLHLTRAYCLMHACSHHEYLLPDACVSTSRVPTA
eukprot:1142859-Pelagomonas_calceolata.AAC.10